MQALRYQRLEPGKASAHVAPPWDRVIVSGEPGAPPWACVVESNPLRPPGGGTRWKTPIDDVNCPARIVAWSGTPAERLFERDPRSWAPEARARFDVICDQLGPRLAERRRRIVFRPCSRHILADAHACAGFLKARSGQPFGLLLDYAGLLEPSMFAQGVDVAMDHARRALEALGPVCDAVLVANARPDEAEGRVLVTPLTGGSLPVDAILKAIEACCPAQAARIVLEEDAAADLRALGD